jgi:hypothetical protein
MGAAAGEVDRFAGLLLKTPVQADESCLQQEEKEKRR